MIGTSRNPTLVAPAGTKNKAMGNGGGGLASNLMASSSLGASIEEINAAVNLNRTLGGTIGGGSRYF